MTPDTLFSLHGKCALVTGGATGIGAAVGGYHAESGATFAIGAASDDQRRCLEAAEACHDAAVAALVRRQAHSADAPAQFITTTFRPGRESNVFFVRRVQRACF